MSSERDLVTGLNDTNGIQDVFLRDMQTGTTELVSWNATGNGTGNRKSGTTQYPFDFGSGSLVLSDDARYVAFTSEASNLVADAADANDSLTEAFGTHRRDVFVRDREADTTNLISRNLAGMATGANGSFTPAMSADGRVVAFESFANDLINGSDGLGRMDVFVRDVTAGRTDLASQRTPLFPDWRLRSAGGQLDDATPDGRFVSFSVDPAHDTPEILAEYARSFKAAPRWLFLTGETEVVYALVRGGFKLGVDPLPEPATAGAASEPITHSTPVTTENLCPRQRVG